MENEKSIEVDRGYWQEPVAEAPEDGIYRRFGEQLTRYQENLKLLETKLTTALSLSEEMADAHLSIPGSPLRGMVEDFSRMNYTLETIIRRIEL